MRIKKTLTALFLAIPLAISGCAGTSPQNGEAATFEFSSEDPQAIVNMLEQLPVADRPADLIASVMPTQLVLQPGQPDEQILPFQTEEFYLSIAPYVNQTHPCTFHSLTTCVGELSKTEIDLEVTDLKTGAKIISEQTVTQDNGFVGVWLPREGSFEIVINGAAGKAKQIVSTGNEDPTCLTTMQLTA